MASTAEIQAHRADVAALTVLAANDIRSLSSEFSTAEAAREAFRDLLPQLLALYGSAAATLGADWYDGVREAVAPPGRFRAIPAELPDIGRTDSLARWAVDPLLGPEPRPEAVLQRASDGLGKAISDLDRQTIAFSAVQDPATQGWQRVGTGECAFCRLLISRGAVYKDTTARFASHDHCRCTAVPAFGGEPLPVTPFTPSTRNVSDADRKRVRDYIRANDL